MVSTALFGVGFGAERLAAFAIKCLAVGGGFLAGYLLGGLVTYALNRWLFAQKTPDLVKKAIRIVSGLLLAILVALIVFGEGGSGLFGGGRGEGHQGGAPGTATTKSDEPSPPRQPEDKSKLPSPPQIDTRPVESTIRVTILGGDDVKEGKFYLIEDDRTPKTFDELKAAISARKEKEKRKMGLMILFPPHNRIARDHRAVTRLQIWAEEAGFDVSFPAAR